MTGSAGFDVRVLVEGELDPAWWSAVVGDLAVAPGSDGTTMLSGRVIDQGAVHGLLAAIRDLGLSLVSIEVARAAPDDGGRSPDR